MKQFLQITGCNWKNNYRTCNFKTKLAVNGLPPIVNPAAQRTSRNCNSIYTSDHKLVYSVISNTKYILNEIENYITIPSHDQFDASLYDLFPY